MELAGRGYLREPDEPTTSANWPPPYELRDALPMERHLRQQARTRRALGDRRGRLRRRLDIAAATAAVLRPRFLDHFQRGRHVLQPLADIFTDLLLTGTPKLHDALSRAGDGQAAGHDAGNGLGAVRAQVQDARIETVVSRRLRQPMNAALLAQRLHQAAPFSTRIVTTVDAGLQRAMEARAAEYFAQLPPPTSSAACGTIQPDPGRNKPP